jgi:hypothetical protein
MHSSCVEHKRWGEAWGPWTARVGCKVGLQKVMTGPFTCHLKSACISHNQQTNQPALLAPPRASTGRKTVAVSVSHWEATHLVVTKAVKASLRDMTVIISGPGLSREC